MFTDPKNLCAMLILTAACGAPDAGVSDRNFQPMPETNEEQIMERPEAVRQDVSELLVRINGVESIEGRLSVAVFAGENAWGWTLDVKENDAPIFPEVFGFDNLEPQIVTVRAVLDRAPYDWINPGAEDLLVTGTLSLNRGENRIDLALTQAPVAPVQPTPDTEDGLTVRVGCNCDDLSHAEIVILNTDGEVLQSETLVDPELPTDLTMDALEPGRYTVAWRTDDYPDWIGERSFRIPLRNEPLMVLFAPNRTDQENPDNTSNNGNNPQPVDQEPENDLEPEDDPEPENDAEPENNPQPRSEPEPQNLLELRETDDFPNRAEQAQPITTRSRIFARLGGARDFDWFVFEHAENGPLVIETTGTTDTRCQLTRDSDRASAQDDDSGDANNCRLAFENLAAGTYRLRISHYSWLGRGDYTLLLNSGGAGQ